MAKKTTTTKSGASATGTTGLTGGNDPTGGTTGTANDWNDPTGGTAAPTGGTTIPTGGTTNPTGGGTGGSTDTSFATDEGVKVTTRSIIINFIIDLCDFAEDSTMVKYIDQQGWTKIHHVTSIGIHEIKDFHTLKDDGFYEAKPLTMHLRLFKGFILYHKRRCRDFSTTLDERDTMSLITKKGFEDYMNSEEFHEDLAAGDTTAKPPPPIVSGVTAAMEDLTVLEFRRGVKRDKTHYEDLKDDKFFNTWNRGFVATAHMHHTHLVLDEGYVPKNASEAAVFKEMQTFMYAVLEDHLKTDKGKSLVSHYETTRDAQSIYRELKKHALSSTAAQLSGDTLLQYITTARFPGSWRGTSYGFVLHWKEQVMKYEKLELEPFGDKQKLRMLQNAVGDVSELSYVKQLGDQDIARGLPPLTYPNYLELLLSACSTYDKKIGTPGKQKRAVYAALVDETDNDPLLNDTNHGGEYGVFQVDTDISDILAYNTNMNRSGASRNDMQTKTKYLPREEWNKLTQDQKNALLEKRRKERFGNTTRQANMHTVDDPIDLDALIDYTIMNHKTDMIDTSSDDPGEKDDLLAFMSGRTKSDAADIRHVLAAKQATDKNKTIKANEATSAPSPTIQIGDTTYYLNKGETITTAHGHQYFAHMALFHYRVGQHNVVQADKALVDRGANGGIVGDDMLILEGNERFVDVSGLDGHKVSQLRIVTAQALIKTHKGDAIATFHQMALLGKGHSILSCIQMESHGAEINDRSSLLPGGKQRIVMDGYQIPLDIVSGLPYLQCRKPTDDELATLPHIIMTSDVDWNPSIHDHKIDDIDAFYDDAIDTVEYDNFNQFGEYRHRTIGIHDVVHDPQMMDKGVYDEPTVNLIETGGTHNCFAISQAHVKPDFQSLRPLFGWFPADTIQRTFDVTTRFARGTCLRHSEATLAFALSCLSM